MKMIEKGASFIRRMRWNGLLEDFWFQYSNIASSTKRVRIFFKLFFALIINIQCRPKHSALCSPCWRKMSKEFMNLIKHKICSRYRLSWRLMDQFKHSNAYEVKVHKPDFPSRVQCRLINPAKSNIGKIRKH